MFECPAATIPNQSRQLNYSANPNICKDGQNSLPLHSDSVPRPVEALTAADAIQYQTNGASHAILWGVRNSQNQDVSFNDGLSANGDRPLRASVDLDRSFAVTDPDGADFRYRHAKSQVEAMFLDGHISSLTKGGIHERFLYTNY